ncbi:hypothetical protein MHC_01030 [Mycoplasma haemocanis str. Illinois]|uniref:Uncharacterized protein n=1 Tax=Mycoplasma haemocanis (strain Illinois) TaxID=1111676 RepID=H6N600_MYCHN|nr:hypothetical protein [Mycoplasma haemocanis]AEW45072.1 hypothetical protein MHC_01030 [Mycoplasma haemocanis str. Illinois]
MGHKKSKPDFSRYVDLSKFPDLKKIKVETITIQTSYPLDFYENSYLSKNENHGLIDRMMDFLFRNCHDGKKSVWDYLEVFQDKGIPYDVSLGASSMTIFCLEYLHSLNEEKVVPRFTGGPFGSIRRSEADLYTSNSIVYVKTDTRTPDLNDWFSAIIHLLLGRIKSLTYESLGVDFMNVDKLLIINPRLGEIHTVKVDSFINRKKFISKISHQVLFNRGTLETEEDLLCFYSMDLFKSVFMKYYFKLDKDISAALEASSKHLQDFFTEKELSYFNQRFLELIISPPAPKNKTRKLLIFFSLLAIVGISGASLWAADKYLDIDIKKWLEYLLPNRK